MKIVGASQYLLVVFRTENENELSIVLTKSGNITTRALQMSHTANWVSREVLESTIDRWQTVFDRWRIESRLLVQAEHVCQSDVSRFWPEVLAVVFTGCVNTAGVETQTP